MIKRFDSLREITESMFPEARKFAHLGINMMPRRSTLSDANARRPESIFETAYRDLYAAYRDELSSDSNRKEKLIWHSFWKKNCIKFVLLQPNKSVFMVNRNLRLSYEKIYSITHSPGH